MIAGHLHAYERIIDPPETGLPYFVNGLGGSPIISDFAAPICGSQFRFNEKYGAQKVTVTSDCMTFEFIDVDGGIQDTYTLDCGECTQGLISPTPCTPICDTSIQFCWNECTDTTYYLGVGTSPESVANSPYGDLYHGYPTSACQTVNNIPSTGTLYVRLWYKEGSGSWGHIDYTYSLDCGGCTQEITSPTPGTQICSTSETFCWNECTDTSYFLGVGTSQSSVASSPWGDIFAGTVTSACQTVNSIPSTGTLYVRLWYKEGSDSWQHIDYTYTGCN